MRGSQQTKQINNLLLAITFIEHLVIECWRIIRKYNFMNIQRTHYALKFYILPNTHTHTGTCTDSTTVYCKTDITPNPCI